jgi:Flp pilus assembly protein TadG
MMTGIRPHRSCSRERGVAMVEFTIVAPLLLLLIFGVTEVGRAIIQYNAVTKSVRDGVRHAAAYGLRGSSGTAYIDPALDAEIRNLIVYGDAQGGATPIVEGLATDQIQITVIPPDIVKVSATYPYSPILGLSLPTFGYGPSPSFEIDLQAAATMRAL